MTAGTGSGFLWRIQYWYTSDSDKDVLCCSNDSINGFTLLTIFARKVSPQMFDWVENRLLAKDFNSWAYFVPRLQIKPKK